MWTTLLSILPLCLLAAVSPVILLRSSGVLAQSGPPAAWRFVCGNLAVLLTLGAAALGALGAGTLTRAERLVASKSVDLVLGLLLLAYGAVLLVRMRRAREHPNEEAPPPRGSFGFGVLSMATNFTTLPLFLSVGQRIGAAPDPAVEKFPLLALAAILVAAPAWLPLLAHRFGSGHPLSPQARRRIAAATQAVSAGACLLGAAFLLARALT